jgi:hypothetical protein
MLVIVLVAAPGGIARVVKPIQNWVAGARWDWSSGKAQSGLGGGMVGRP